MGIHLSLFLRFPPTGERGRPYGYLHFPFISSFLCTLGVPVGPFGGPTTFPPTVTFSPFFPPYGGKGKGKGGPLAPKGAHARERAFISSFPRRGKELIKEEEKGGPQRRVYYGGLEGKRKTLRVFPPFSSALSLAGGKG